MSARVSIAVNEAMPSRFSSVIGLGSLSFVATFTPARARPSGTFTG